MATSDESSLVLLQRARAGDARALDHLLERYLPRMRRWASGRLPHTARGLLDTEDVVQETLVKAVRNLNTLEVRDAGALQAYLCQALRNRLSDAYRRSHMRAVDTSVKSDLPDREPSPLEHAIGQEALERYEAGLGKLTATDREAIILRVELCYDYDEIGRMLGKSNAASARVTVSRALARLSRAMDA